MDEFTRIATYFAPLAAKAKGALGLTDDAAFLAPPPNEQLVVTQDTIVEGVHFIGDEPARQIAQKALRVNLSDLAAKGATPLAYFLSLSLPPSRDEQWIADFATGLAADQDSYGITLMGGDSTASRQGVVITITAMGSTPSLISRSGAQAGDIVYVTGTIGDAALGLQAARGEGGDASTFDRYRLPQPRLAAIPLLRAFATASLDVSDGLLQDIQHISKQSKLGIDIALERLPLSDSAAHFAHDAEHLLQLATGGDDYEIAFTAPPEETTQIQQYAKQAGLRVTAIGSCKKGASISISYAEKALPLPPILGYTHSL